MITQYFRSLGRRISLWRRQLRRRPYSTGVRSFHKTTGNKVPRVSQFRHLSRILNPQERGLFRIAVLLLVVGIVWLAMSIINIYRVQVPASGGTYIEAVVGAPEFVNPLFASLNDADRDIVRLVYSGLMRFNSSGVLVPDLAASVSVDETETVYTVTLRKDVVWHDGEVFTAADVLFTFESIQDETIGSPLYMTFHGVAVEVLDEYTVQFTLQEPFAPFLQSLTVGILPEHVWASISPDRFLLSQRNLQPVGTGPFQFSRLVKDATGSVFEYRLEQFDRYYRELPYIETFVFTYYPVYDGEAGAIRALRQQAVQGLHFVPTDLREQVDGRHTVLHTLQLPQYTALFFNSERETALGDASVREALVLALDKERIVREALGGEGARIDGPILPGFPGYDEALPADPYDITRSNELLSANWTVMNAKTYFEFRKKEITDQLTAQARAAQERATELADAAGTEAEGGATTSTEPIAAPVTISTSSIEAEAEQILTGEVDSLQTFYRRNNSDIFLELDLVTVDTQEYRRAAAIIEASWQEVGIIVNVAYIPAREFSRSVLRDRSYDVLLYGVILGSDPDQYPFWHSSQVAAPGLNLAQYKNSTVDTLLTSVRSATDDTEVDRLYREFQTQILTDRPAIFLYTPTYTYAQSADVRGFHVSQIFVPSDRLSNVHEWYIKTRGTWKK